MNYKITFDECPHCKDISDGRALDQHIQIHRNSMQANAKLGLIFIGVAAMLGAFLFLVLSAN